MNIKRVYAIFLRQSYLIRNNTTRAIPIFIWIVVDVVLWGFMSKYISTIAASGLSFIPLLLGAVLLWDFLVQSMQGVTMSFFEDVWSRNFLNFFASPLLVSEYIAGLVLSSIARSVLALIAMLILATLVFGISIFIYGSSLALFLLILFFFGITLGILGISIVLRLGPAAEWFVWPIPALLSPFVGVFYPLSILPIWMQYVGRALPPSYVFDGVRSIVGGHGFPVATLLMGVGLSVIYIFLAYGIFILVYKKAIRTGLIARYSAENVS
jgi:ABC-2 type transport system permease protein